MAKKIDSLEDWIGADRSARLELIWKHTYRDFRGGKGADRTVLVQRAGLGTCSIRLSDLTDDDVARKAPRIGLWRLNAVIGRWDAERYCALDEAAKWLEIFRRDQPGVEFRLAFEKPETDAERELRQHAAEQRKRATR